MNTPVAPGLVAVRASGVWVETADGRRVMDCTSGMATANLGHNHPRVMAAARAQMDRQLHTGGVFGTAAAHALAERLAAATPGRDRRLLVRHLRRRGGGGRPAPGRPRHRPPGGGRLPRRLPRAHPGRARLLQLARRHPRRLGLPRGRRAPEPLPGARAPGEDAAAARALDALDDLHRHELAPADTACYLVEPVQGHGGCHPAGRAFLAGLRERADRHGMLLIFDEVQTGFGRVGAPFAADLYGVRPDLICLAKAIANGFPLSAVGGPPELLARWPQAGPGGTFGGGPVSCAAACAVLDTLAAGGPARARPRPRRRGRGAAARPRPRALRPGPDARCAARA